VNAGVDGLQGAARQRDPVQRARMLASASLWLVLPLCALAYQIAAKKVSGCSIEAGVAAWFGCVLRAPWFAVMIVSDIAGFGAWMYVLGRMQLSAAFPMTALSYVLVIAASRFLFGEPFTLLQVCGSALIMAGVFMLGRVEPEHA